MRGCWKAAMEESWFRHFGEEEEEEDERGGQDTEVEKRSGCSWRGGGHHHSEGKVEEHEEERTNGRKQEPQRDDQDSLDSWKKGQLPLGGEGRVTSSSLSSSPSAASSRHETGRKKTPSSPSLTCREDLNRSSLCSPRCGTAGSLVDAGKSGRETLECAQESTPSSQKKEKGERRGGGGLVGVIEDDMAAYKALDVLKSGYKETRSFGSSTALVVCIDGKRGKLGIANLGDSAVMVLRKQMSRMTCAHRSKEQQHQFNCPYQLSRLPRPSDYPSLVARGMGSLTRVLQNASMLPQDTPDMARVYSVNIEEGDLVLLGTDGVFDNLFDHEICGLASHALSPYEAEVLLHDPSRATAAQAVAAAIAKAAAYKR